MRRAPDAEAEIGTLTEAWMKKLFTERHGEAKPRVAEALNDAIRNGLLTLVNSRIDEEWFGLALPNKCGDGYAYVGTDSQKLEDTMTSYGVMLPGRVDRDRPPSDGQVFDLLEFAYEFIAEAPIRFTTAI